MWSTPAWVTDVELFVSANDAKLVRYQGRDAFPDDPGPDTLRLLDLGATCVLASVPVQY